MAEKQEIQRSKYELKAPKSAEGKVPKIQDTKYPLKVPATPEKEAKKEKPRKARRKSGKK